MLSFGMLLVTHRLNCIGSSTSKADTRSSGGMSWRNLTVPLKTLDQAFFALPFELPPEDLEDPPPDCLLAVPSATNKSHSDRTRSVEWSLPKPLRKMQVSSQARRSEMEVTYNLLVITSGLQSLA